MSDTTTPYTPTIGEEVVITAADSLDPRYEEDLYGYSGLRAQVLPAPTDGSRGVYVRITDPRIPTEIGQDVWVAGVGPTDIAYWRKEAEGAYKSSDRAWAECRAAERRLEDARDETHLAALERVRAERDRYRAAWRSARERSAFARDDQRSAEQSSERWQAETAEARAERDALEEHAGQVRAQVLREAMEAARGYLTVSTGALEDEAYNQGVQDVIDAIHALTRTPVSLVLGAAAAELAAVDPGKPLRLGACHTAFSNAGEALNHLPLAEQLAAMEQAREALPDARPGVTRGEYAELLRTAAGA